MNLDDEMVQQPLLITDLDALTKPASPLPLDDLDDSDPSPPEPSPDVSDPPVFRYFSVTKPQCIYCQSYEHLRSNCPHAPEFGCFVCGRDHLARDCPIKIYDIIDLNSEDYCYKCHGSHHPLLCPDDNNPFCGHCYQHNHISKHCYKRGYVYCTWCGRAGHIYSECHNFKPKFNP
ncbi:hypothetical protein RCL1_001140 [Eukaryota sp. TZLM3-RCL]